jgi:flagellar hook protein FlgE
VPTATIGGINPTQVGLGVQNGYISPIFTQGALQSTGRNLDLAIQGDGFFVYDQGAARRYSREGSIALDSNGYLVNAATGLRLQGWTANAAGQVDTNLPANSIQIPSNRTMARATSTALLGGNLNADMTAVPVGTVVPVTMGAYDSLGNMVPVTVNFTRTAANTWSWATTGGSGTLTFDASGRLPTNTTGTATIPGGAGANPINMTLNFSNVTMLAAPNSTTVTSQDGLPTGSVSDVYITPNGGAIFLVYSNGMREQIGQVAVARFTNPGGLIRTGYTMFQQGLNSGEPQLGAPNSGGRGPIASGYLESSNVDMAQEFTNMILAQRGFQASSRVITTSDEIIQELVNLKR